MSRTSFYIDDHPIGQDASPFVIAEAGVHHYNSVALAKEYITQAALAGAHAIKFQTYSADRLATTWAPTYWDDGSGRTQHDIFAERDKLTRNDYAAMFEHAREVGITMLSTPFDESSASMLNEFEMPAFKIASADLTNHPLLKEVASFGKPVLMSTGASEIDEIRQAVEVVGGYDVPIALLHCNLSYPTPIKEANLRRIEAIQNEFPDAVLGYSDHTQPQDSELACPLSVALGVRIVEKHYTLNKYLREDDHYHAADQDGLARLVKNCQDAFSMTNAYREMTESEEGARQYARRSVVAAIDLSEGTVLTEKHIDYKRPGTGVSPANRHDIIGKKLRSNMKRDELIKREDVE